MADYSNRSDLRNPATSTARFTGQTYGEATQQAQSQQMVRPGVSPTTVDAQQMAARPRPGQQPLNRPTERPNEPLTAGAPFGPGPGPMEMQVRPRMLPGGDVVDRLVALYNMYPNDQLRVLIQRMMER